KNERTEFASSIQRAVNLTKKAASFSSALNSISAGDAPVEMDSRQRHNLAFELALHRAECEFLTRRVDAAQQRLRALSLRAANLLERAAVTCQQADVYLALQRPDRGLVECAEYLSLAGFEISLGPTEAQARAAYDEVCST